MQTLALVLLTACSTTQIPSPAADADSEAAAPAPVAAVAPEVSMDVVYHGTLRMKVGDTVVWVDPWSRGPLEGAEKADIVFLTDIHQDHLDPDGLAAVSKEGTVIVAPQAVAEELEGVDHVLNNGDTLTLGAIGIEAVPMYNLTRGPEEGELFHTKGRGNGYVLTVAGLRYYIAGDTACTPEMMALRDIHHAFVPMNLPYTMPPDEAAGCVAAFAPTHVTPYHYGDSDLQVFADALSVMDVEVHLVDAYPGGLPF